MITAENRLFTSTFAIQHPDVDVLHKMLTDTIGKAVESATKDMEDNGFLMDKPDLTLVSHNGAIFGTLLVWGRR